MNKLLLVWMRPDWVTSLKHDFLASLVVFLVALPLCLGIAIASGVPPEKAAAVGVLTGIVGGLVVGPLAGSPLQVSGPAAGLSVLILELVQEHGWEKIGIMILLAGEFQLVAGILKLGQWFRAVSPAVIHGMLAGIGVLIMASQFHIMVDDSPKESGIRNLVTIPEALWKGMVPSDVVSHDDAARIGLLTIAMIVLWKLLAPKKLHSVPAPLVAIVVATGVTALLFLPIKQVALPDNLLDAISLPAFQAFAWRTEWRTVLLAAGSIAFVASAETLLCATAVDNLHSGPCMRYDRELVAQGVGNALCGFVGGLPVTGVIVRSATNIESGARTRVSAILHGFWLLGFAALFPAMLRLIPTCSLAAILVYTGYKLVNPSVVRTLWKYGKGEVLIYTATLGAIVFTDLLTGIVAGMGLSLVKLLYTFSRLRIRLVEDLDRQRTILYLRGAATFVRLPRLAAALETVSPGAQLHVHLEELSYIDHACLDLLMTWEKQHRATGGMLVIDWEMLTARFHGRKRTKRILAEQMPQTSHSSA